MTSSNSCLPPEHIRSLIPLGTYEWPRSEAEQTIGHLVEKLKSSLNATSEDTAIDLDKLQNRSDEKMRAALEDALQAVLFKALDTTYLEWTRSSEGTQTSRVLISPPMDTDILAEWAKTHNLPVLSDISQLQETPSASCLVLPKLEVFFRRRVQDLSSLFSLFEALAACKGRILIGCNSWARTVLRQFDETQFLLDSEDTFPPFDADALAHILDQALDPATNVKSVMSGNHILERDDEAQLVDPFLRKLAEESLGHPWVAAEMFLQGMAEAADTDKNTSENQLWVKLPAGCSLPAPTNEALLFALHTLLIHGSRPMNELNELLPTSASTGVWLTLQRNGFVELKDGHISCVNKSYPDIRSELGAAGFNLDRL